MKKKQLCLLHRLARFYGIQTTYRDFKGRCQEADPQPLLTVLQVLGAPVENLTEVHSAVRERRQELWRRFCEPVVVAWDGEPVQLELRLPASQAECLVDIQLELENGEVRQWTSNLSHLPIKQGEVVEEVDYVVKQLVLPSGLPWGYHQCTLAIPGYSHKTMIISAPLQAYDISPGTLNRLWGVFLPLYALHSKQSWAAGDFFDLEVLLQWVRKLGGSLVGTLPLLSTFLDKPFDPSPYAPVSRLFWNEFFLNINRIPELNHCPQALDLLDSAAFQKEIADLRAIPIVDYRRGLAAKRKILEILARCCSDVSPERHAALKRWAADNPTVKNYARFRATVEQQHTTWPNWPERMRNGKLQEGDYDPETEFYHLYVQWLAHKQFQALSEQAQQQGNGLYLDFPLGVHSAGYDVWRERTAFALKASCGAPPDLFFNEGQNWGFPPLHPERIRQQGYSYYIACLRHHLRHAKVLRLDHVMGFHRLFWIPAGLSAREGVYVQYHADEFYAILALESHRYSSLLVGEDLGTVPTCVRTAMARHGIYRMFVLPFKVNAIFENEPVSNNEKTNYVKESVFFNNSGSGGEINLIPTRALACLNTHDMLPFTAFWLQENKTKRASLFEFLRREDWYENSTDDVREILKSCLKYLAASKARILLVNLEDLWFETSPQNIPGTNKKYPNWQRKARKSLEEFSQIPEVLKILSEVDKLRKCGKRVN